MFFYKGGLSQIHTDVLYSFIKAPEHFNPMFFGILDITQNNTIIAVLVAIGQYFQIKFTMPLPKPAANGKKDTSFQGELAKSMSMQMKYVMPIFMFFIARSFPAMVSLYLITSSVFAIGQEIYMRKKISREED
jgi:membrane protein insertase Oxa1/YidC/SpoIIIJ